MGSVPKVLQKRGAEGSPIRFLRPNKNHKEEIDGPEAEE